MFGTRLPLARAYADLLASAGVERGLIGPREVPRLWERHLLNCALLTDVIPPDLRVVDVGSGAGLPGLVVALRRPDLQVTLLEPLLRRTTFLHEAVESLGLDNVIVVRGRAEEVAGRVVGDVVTARALAPLEQLLRWSLPLTTPSGEVVALKGSAVQDEIAALPEALRAVVRVESAGSVEGVLPSTVVRVESAAARRVGWPPRGRSRPGSARRRRS